jgi:predicted ABC-type transport system involved in lysophospholipase L1 biosynthesis ATPase subunit
MAVAAAPLIALDNVSRVFDDGAVVALAGIDIAIAPGEFVSIVGPSGSGKSSLVHLMAGFDRPTGGRVLGQGQEVRDRRQWTTLRRNQIGIVFQEFLLLPTLTAIENVEIAMSGTGLAAAERRKRAAALLDQVGLGGRQNHLPFAMSGGERQRVAIARSLANRPQLLLSDEPTGNLDSANAAAVVELLLALRTEAGMTLVLVTHDEALAARADRQIHVRDGKIADGAAAAGGAAP